MAQKESLRHEDFSPQAMGRRVFGMIKTLDSRLSEIPDFETNKIPATSILTGKEVKENRRYQSAFNKLRNYFVVTVKDSLSRPTLRRTIEIRDETDPKQHIVTKVKLRTIYSRPEPSAQTLEFRRGLVKVKDESGVHKNDKEALDKATDVILSI